MNLHVAANYLGGIINMNIKKTYRKFSVVGVMGFVLVFSACGKSVTVKSGGTPVTELNGQTSTPPRATPSTRAIRGRKTAVRHLMTSARRQAQAGHFATAAELLERGLRIDPYDAKLWGKLASIRFKQKQYQLSESLAHKSNSFAEHDRVLKLKNWRLIAESRNLRGNKAGADAALQKVRSLLH